jgi:hypothetical protein
MEDMFNAGDHCFDEARKFGVELDLLRKHGASRPSNENSLAVAAWVETLQGHENRVAAASRALGECVKRHYSV